MEKRIFANLVFDTDKADKKLQAVIEAHAKFMQALSEYQESVDYDSIKVEIEG